MKRSKDFAIYFRNDFAELGGTSLEEQDEYVSLYLDSVKGSNRKQSFYETAETKENNWQKLREAMEYCQEKGYSLLISSTDELENPDMIFDPSFIAVLWDYKVYFIAADNTNFSSKLIGLVKAMSLHNQTVNSPTKQPDTARRSNKQVKPKAFRKAGIPASEIEKRKRAANDFALSLSEVIIDLHKQGYTSNMEKVKKLNEMDIKTRKGADFTVYTFARVIKRLREENAISF